VKSGNSSFGSPAPIANKAAPIAQFASSTSPIAAIRGSAFDTRDPSTSPVWPASPRKSGQSARVAAVPGPLLLLADQAVAQSLRQTGVSIFEVIYSIVGVIGAIACLVTLLNWVTGNWLGRDDPRKLFFQGLLGTGLAFSVVAIVQFVKDAVGGSASGISSL
jgi:hypothetical protein